MGTCKECKYWDNSTTPFANKESAGYCQKLTRGCSGVVGVFNPEMTIDSTFKLLTRPEFGCVYFEPKPEGPFSVQDYQGHRPDSKLSSSIVFKACGIERESIYRIDSEVARGLVYWLNALWAERKRKPLGSVHEVRLY